MERGQMSRWKTETAIRQIRMWVSPRGKSIPAPILTLGNPSLQKPLPASPSGMWMAAQTHIVAHQDWNCRRGGLAAVVDDFDERVFMVKYAFFLQ